MQEDGPGYGPQCDVYSAGCVVYSILSGFHPFDAGGKAKPKKGADSCTLHLQSLWIGMYLMVTSRHCLIVAVIMTASSLGTGVDAYSLLCYPPLCKLSPL